jgi:hypothetical protein
LYSSYCFYYIWFTMGYMAYCTEIYGGLSRKNLYRLGCEICNLFVCLLWKAWLLCHKTLLLFFRQHIMICINLYNNTKIHIKSII